MLLYVIYLPWAGQWCRWWWWRWRPLRQSTQPLLTDFFSFTYSPVGHIQSSYRKETAQSRQFFFWFLIAAKIWYYSSLSFCIADEREKGTEGIAHRLGWLMWVIPTIRGQLHVDVMDAIINTAMFFPPFFFIWLLFFRTQFCFFLRVWLLIILFCLTRTALPGANIWAELYHLIVIECLIIYPPHRREMVSNLFFFLLLSLLNALGTTQQHIVY